MAQNIYNKLFIFVIHTLPHSFVMSSNPMPTQACLFFCFVLFLPTKIKTLTEFRKRGKQISKNLVSQGAKNFCTIMVWIYLVNRWYTLGGGANLGSKHLHNHALSLSFALWRPVHWWRVPDDANNL